MNKELAKKLHEAGFPNLAIYRHDFIEEPNDNPFKTGWDIKATCKLCGEKREYASGGFTTSDYYKGCTVISDYGQPTLEELIEACGHPSFFLFINGFDTLFVWGASISNKEETFWGATPSEAVANLWIALNKK